jgi:hypothetical protein
MRYVLIWHRRQTPEIIKTFSDPVSLVKWFDSWRATTPQGVANMDDGAFSVRVENGPSDIHYMSLYDCKMQARDQLDRSLDTLLRALAYSSPRRGGSLGGR